MRRIELLQEIRKMRFEEAYTGWTEKRLTQKEAARLLAFFYATLHLLAFELNLCSMNCPHRCWKSPMSRWAWPPGCCWRRWRSPPPRDSSGA
ncbi:hypothetical protein SAMN05443662_1489 [Sulfurivirga caldicuralii]|uniref:Uncharacterized protein n=1 Tax=Sulfurivirga caldicuralii TaxID=364032 RepID=A0A1N6GTT6_9GAMM|nr:hypothetical protein SAMN05443662_1489 [Sulfurivirga caldicuralii]